ncbi:MAG: response regulator [Lachnospiraceae bacterium]|jgi:two-component system chemotaxis response regulator CheY|nr:response regulator [Lachnospiraceae bacterium]
MDLTNKKILISDDSILARKQLKDIISRVGEGAEFIDASNGQEAIDKYKEFTPDITFLDIVMPVKDGIEAVKGIMEINNEADIIIVSSVGTQSQLKSAIEAGAKDFIQKPLDSSQVETLLQSHLG